LRNSYDTPFASKKQDGLQRMGLKSRSIHGYETKAVKPWSPRKCEKNLILG